MNEKLEALNQEIENGKEAALGATGGKASDPSGQGADPEGTDAPACTRAAMLESYLPHPEAITDEQVSLFLKLLLHKDSTRQLMEKVFAGNGTEKEGAE